MHNLTDNKSIVITVLIFFQVYCEKNAVPYNYKCQLGFT